MAAAPAAVAQRQLDAYNAHDLAAFVACCAEDVTIWRLPATTPARQGRAGRLPCPRALRPRAAARRGGSTAGRSATRWSTTRVRGLHPEPHETVALHPVAHGLIRAAWSQPTE